MKFDITVPTTHVPPCGEVVALAGGGFDVGGQLYSQLAAGGEGVLVDELGRDDLAREPTTVQRLDRLGRCCRQADRVGKENRK